MECELPDENKKSGLPAGKPDVWFYVGLHEGTYTRLRRLHIIIPIIIASTQTPAPVIGTAATPLTPYVR